MSLLEKKVFLNTKTQTLPQERKDLVERHLEIKNNDKNL
jgi:hypothetical protein